MVSQDTADVTPFFWQAVEKPRWKATRLRKPTGVQDLCCRIDITGSET